MKLFLDGINEIHPHIHFEKASIDQSGHFFNAYIENRHGNLYTRIYHDSPISKYALPYVIGHAKLDHSLWFRSALIRAVRVCSHYLDFLLEQNYLEVTCLTNGYSIDFIETQLKHFYLRYNAEKIRFCLDQTVYERLRRRLLDFIPLQRTQLDKDQDLEDQEYRFYFSYPYDSGSYNQFKNKFYQLWSTYLKDDAQLAHKDTKISLHSKHMYSLNTFFGEEKPTDELYKKLSKKTTL